MLSAVNRSDLLWVLAGFFIALPVPHIVRLFDSSSSSSSSSSALRSEGGDTSSTTNNNNNNDNDYNNRRTTIAAASSSSSVVTKKYSVKTDQYFCNHTRPFLESASDYPEWDIIGDKPHKWGDVKCHWAQMWHPSVPMTPLPVCTHDPATDGVISTFLHTYHFWGGPDDYNLLLAMGPCTQSRPYMLDIGANLGVYTILGASRGCRSVSFEPLSQNILRLRESLKAQHVEKRALLFKHAVGKSFGDVKIGFRAFNPGASAIGIDADVTEHMAQITIDGLLLGDHGRPPLFEDDENDPFPNPPPFIGKYINFVKIDTEGYDVAVVSGMLKTLIEGRPPHILIEFGPNDAAGTAGCNPFHFVQLMYGAGYRMYEQAKAANLKVLLEEELPIALTGKGKRVFESWFIHDDAAVSWVELGLLQAVDTSESEKKRDASSSAAGGGA